MLWLFDFFLKGYILGYMKKDNNFMLSVLYIKNVVYIFNIFLYIWI